MHPGGSNPCKERYIAVKVTDKADKQVPSGSGLKPRDVALMSEEEQIQHAKDLSMADVPPCPAPDSPPLTTQEMRDTDLIVMNALRNRAIYNRDTDRCEGQEQDSDTLIPKHPAGTTGAGNQDTPLGPPGPVGASSNPIIVDTDRDGSRVYPIQHRKRAISVSPELTKPKKASRKGDIPTSDKPTGKDNDSQPPAQQTHKEPAVWREARSLGNQIPSVNHNSKSNKVQAIKQNKTQPTAHKQPQATGVQREVNAPKQPTTRLTIKTTTTNNTDGSNCSAPLQQRMPAGGTRDGHNNNNKQRVLTPGHASRVKWPAQFMSHWYGILFTE